MVASTPISGNPFATLIPTRMESKESWRWGAIQSVAPLRVKLDGDTEALTASPDTLVPVKLGDRVRVHVYNRRATIIGVNGGAIPEQVFQADVAGAAGDLLLVAGKTYPRTGLVAVPAFTWAATYAGPAYCATVPIPNPYAPPEGYGFVYEMAATSGWTWCSTVQMGTASSSGRIRIIQFGYNSTTAATKLAWRLAKIN